MANWTGPDPNRLLPGEPWTSDLALAAFEDPVAIAEGATGAPRLYGKAAVPRSQQTELDVLSVSASNDYAWSDLMYSGNFLTTTTSSGFYQSAGTITVKLATGTARFEAFFTSEAAPGGGQGARLLKNGSQIDTFIGAFSADVAVSPGDQFEFQVKSNSGDTSTISSMVIYSTDAYQRIGIPIRGTDL